MDLSGASIQGSGVAVPVLEGDLSCVFRDRRLPLDNKPLIGPAARRRQPPAVVANLVGSGKLWVAQGYFTVAASEMARWGRSNEIALVVDELTFHITLLKPQPAFDPSEKTWVFYALFVPQAADLGKLPVVEHNPANGKASDPLVKYLNALLEFNPDDDFFAVQQDPVGSS